MARYRPILLASLLIFALLAGTPAGAQMHRSAETGASEPTPAQAPTPTQRPTPTQAPKPTERPATRIYLPLFLAVRLPMPDHLWADRYRLEPGECTNIHWSVMNARAVYLDNMPVTGHETRQVCPANTTTYVLRVVRASGAQEYRVTIVVDAGNHPLMEFWADAYQVERGGCTVLHWRVTEARAVYLNHQGVTGESTQQVCPNTSTTYVLDVEFTNGATATWRLTITVVPTDTLVMQFWADQYTLGAGQCTTLYWKVENAREVYLDDEGVPAVGARQVCPSGMQFYTLRAVDSTGTSTVREITLMGSDPVLSASEVVAQGLVIDLVHLPDVDPAQPGDQAGYRLGMDNVKPLFVGQPGWAEAAVTLGVPQSFIKPGSEGPVEWPIHPGQSVEFRATCSGPICVLTTVPGSYLRLRSE